MRDFEHLGLKNVIGAADGTYISIWNAPNKDPEVYFTKKKRYCYLLSKIELFYWFWCRLAGSIYDAWDFRNSSFIIIILIQDDNYLLSDSPYPISPFLIPPLSSQKHKEFTEL